MNAVKFFLAAVCGVLVTGSLMAGPHGPPPRHHGGSDGVVLATQIVDLVKSVIAPPTVVVRETAPVVVQQPAVVQQPVVVQCLSGNRVHILRFRPLGAQVKVAFLSRQPAAHQQRGHQQEQILLDFFHFHHQFIG